MGFLQTMWRNAVVRQVVVLVFVELVTVLLGSEDHVADDGDDDRIF
jgi:hypothetical protein